MAHQTKLNIFFHQPVANICGFYQPWVLSDFNFKTQQTSSIEGKGHQCTLISFIYYTNCGSKIKLRVFFFNMTLPPVNIVSLLRKRQRLHYIRTVNESIIM